MGNTRHVTSDASVEGQDIVASEAHGSGGSWPTASPPVRTVVRLGRWYTSSPQILNLGLSARELACHASLTSALQVSRHLW